MKKVLGLLCVIIGMTCVFSCSESEDIESINKQTVLVYMPWTGSESSQGLYSFFKANLDSIYLGIKQKKGLGTSRLIVFLSESATKSTLFEVTYDGTECQKQTLKEYSGREYTTQEGITQILIDVKGFAYGLNYAMIIGSHGNGWTFKEDWTNYPYRAKTFGGSVDSKETERVPYATFDGELTEKHTRFFGSISDINGFSVDVPTLANAIKNAEMKMQYIYFDDCYMANVEVAYELREVTNYLVTSTCEMMATGTPFKSAWTYMASPTPNYAMMVSNFVRYYRNTPAPYATLSAIDCRNMDQLALMMKDINSQYQFDPNLLDNIQIMDGFDHPIFYDMRSYLSNLCTNERQLNQVLSVLEKAVPYKDCTEQFYSYIYGEQRKFDIKTYSGITISDPSLNEVALKGKEKTSWWKATH